MAAFTLPPLRERAKAFSYRKSNKEGVLPCGGYSKIEKLLIFSLNVFAKKLFYRQTGLTLISESVPTIMIRFAVPVIPSTT